MPRQARLDAPGTLHHVILRGIEKKKIVDDRHDRKTFIEFMGQTALENDIKIYAWALMTNHAHILLKSGKKGLSQYMRRFLTRYAMAYNRRHKRYGYLFQNRFKSIVCEEDAYFQELVRYIHLNPIRAKMIKTISELDAYAYCGHSCLMGNVKYEWQDKAYVLKWFGKREDDGKKVYRQYIADEINQGSRPELVGGNLIRSIGKWSNVSTLREGPERDKGKNDPRILGSADFVERIMKEADEQIKHQIPINKIREKIQERIERICKTEKVLIQELLSGSRRGQLPQIRAKIALSLVKEYGISLAELGRQLGVTTAAVSRMLSKLETDL
jgi:REP element-mobilizing transposase RayT/predicted transcriptional regulator